MKRVELVMAEVLHYGLRLSEELEEIVFEQSLSLPSLDDKVVIDGMRCWLAWELGFDRTVAVFTPTLRVWSDEHDSEAELVLEEDSPILMSRGIAPVRFDLREEVVVPPIPGWVEVVPVDTDLIDTRPEVKTLACFKSEALKLKAEFDAQYEASLRGEV